MRMTLKHDTVAPTHPPRVPIDLPVRHLIAQPVAPANGVSDCSAVHDTDFVSLQNAYRSSGGLAQGEELAARLHVSGEGGNACLARWIVSRQVFSFSWHDHFWLPLFQFDLAHMTLRQGLRPVLSELSDLMDGSALAAWFARPNDSLQGHSPVAMWSNRWPEVFQAARLQRRAMKG